MSRPEQDKGENVTRLRPILFQNKLNWVENQGQIKISENFQYFFTVILMCFKLQNNQVSLKKSCFDKNKAGYMATEVACGWAGAICEVTRSLGQEQ